MQIFPVLHTYESYVNCQGLAVVKPIVFGNRSQYFGKKRESDGHTHWWQVYVKPYIENEVRLVFWLVVPNLQLILFLKYISKTL